jgi:hypothetical protein
MSRSQRRPEPCSAGLVALLQPALLSAVALAALVGAGAARADYMNGLSTQEQRLYDYGPGGSNGTSKSGAVLDTANPLDLMNKIRKGTAMDDATPPTDAVDAALKALEVQTPAAPGPAAPLVMAP